MRRTDASKDVRAPVRTRRRASPQTPFNGARPIPGLINTQFALGPPVQESLESKHEQGVVSFGAPERSSRVPKPGAAVFSPGHHRQPLYYTSAVVVVETESPSPDSAGISSCPLSSENGKAFGAKDDSAKHERVPPLSEGSTHGPPTAPKTSGEMHPLHVALQRRSRRLVRQAIQNPSLVLIPFFAEQSSRQSDPPTASVEEWPSASEELLAKFLACRRSQQSFITLLFRGVESNPSCVIRASLDEANRVSLGSSQELQLRPVVVPLTSLQDEGACLRFVVRQLFELVVAWSLPLDQRHNTLPLLSQFARQAGIEWALMKSAIERADRQAESLSQKSAAVSGAPRASHAPGSTSRRITRSAAREAQRQSISGKSENKLEDASSSVILSQPIYKLLSFQQNIMLIKVLLCKLKSLGIAPVLIVDSLETLVFGTGCSATLSWSTGRQALLYNIFNLIHLETACIGFVGCTGLLNITSYFEKRIQSRFGLSKIYSDALLRNSDQLAGLLSFSFSLSKQEEQNDSNLVDAYNCAVERFFKSSSSQDTLRFVTALEHQGWKRALQILAVDLLQHGILRVAPFPIETIRNSGIKAAHELVSPNPPDAVSSPVKSQRCSALTGYTEPQTPPYRLRKSGQEEPSSLTFSTPRKRKRRDKTAEPLIEVDPLPSTSDPSTDLRSDRREESSEKKTRLGVSPQATEAGVLQGFPTFPIASGPATPCKESVNFFRRLLQHNSRFLDPVAFTAQWEDESWHDALLQQLSLCELHILAAMTQLHRKHVVPKTLSGVLLEIAKIEKLASLSTGQLGAGPCALQSRLQSYTIAFQRLLEWNLLHISFLGERLQATGDVMHLPVKYVYHKRFRALATRLYLPSYLERYIQAILIS